MESIDAYSTTRAKFQKASHRQILQVINDLDKKQTNNKDYTGVFTQQLKSSCDFTSTPSLKIIQEDTLGRLESPECRQGQNPGGRIDKLTIIDQGAASATSGKRATSNPGSLETDTRGRHCLTSSRL